MKAYLFFVKMSAIMCLSFMFTANGWAERPKYTIQQASDISILKEELDTITKQINELQLESDKHTGGLIKVTLDSSIASRNNTKAIISKNLSAVTNCTKSKAKSSKSQNNLAQLKDLAVEIVTIDQQIEVKQVDADRHQGGLIWAHIISTITTMQNTRAILEERFISTKYESGCPKEPNIKLPKANSKSLTNNDKPNKSANNEAEVLKTTAPTEEETQQTETEAKELTEKERSDNSKSNGRKYELCEYLAKFGETIMAARQFEGVTISKTMRIIDEGNQTNEMKQMLEHIAHKAYEDYNLVYGQQTKKLAVETFRNKTYSWCVDLVNKTKNK
ncbi:MAG: hypothetical protein WCK54_14075 [Desulfuromonadales bacterium]